MKSCLGHAVLFFAVFFISLLTIAPANYFAQQMQGQIKGVTLQGVGGTLWSGNIQALEIEGFIIENIEWSLSPFALLLGHAQLDFSSLASDLQSAGRVDVNLFNQEIEISSAMLRFPLESYAQMLGVSELGLSGQLELQLEEASYHEGRISNTTGQLIWHQAGIKEALGLGTIEASLQQIDGELRATLNDREGPVIIGGEFIIQATGRYQFNATFSARDSSDVELKQTLRLMGRTIGENKVQVKDKGEIVLPKGLTLG